MADRRAPTLTLARAGTATPAFVLLAVTTAVLVLLGLVMTFSASFVRSAAETGDAFAIFQRQLLWCAVGLPPMVVAASIDYRWWRRLAPALFVVAFVLTALVLVPGIGVMANGARRWLELGPARFQPSELLKLTVPLYLGHLLTARWGRLRAGDLHALLMPAVPLLAVASFLVLVEPDLETALLVASIGGLVLFTAGLPLRIVGVGAAVTTAAAAFAIVSTPFRRARFVAWLAPMGHADTFGYQTVQGLIALGSGGVTGVGLGQGRGKWLYVPNAHTDFIYAIIGEELGLVGALFVLVLFAALAIGGGRAALRAPDPFGRLVAAGIVGWILMQAGMNMGSVVGVLPVTGVTLPLVSFGGSSLVFSMLGLGVLMSIARAGTERRDPIGGGGA
jgi:cell division protein FtsW